MSERSSPPNREHDIPTAPEPTGAAEQLARMAERYAALLEEHRKRVEDLTQAIEIRDEFIAIAAHELRNPMSAIVLSVQNLKMASQRAAGTCPPKLEEKLTALENRIHHYVRRASLLLDVTRLTSGKFEMEIEAVDLSQLTHEVVSSFVDELARADCHLEMQLADRVTGAWDRMGLEQVVMNLISNAIKYGAGKPIRVSLQAQQGSAMLEVVDAGMGISTDDQQRIFEKFERAVRRRQHGGFGVGLWITRQIVERLGGTIAVHSEPDRGSTFTVVLPQAPSPS
jgi:signal transduction histidine kinase